MTLTSPIPFRDALRRLDRRILPTPMSTAELDQLGNEVLERASFSARTTLEGYLEPLFEDIRDLVRPQTQFRPDPETGELKPFTAGLDRATVRARAMERLKRLGYAPDEDIKGTIQDLSSESRINLVIDMNTAEARAYGHHLQSLDPDFADAFPAQELVRFEDRMEPRDWSSRWQSAIAEVGDTDAIEASRRSGGRMVARKDSPVWTAISRFGRPWPPFDFNSGMGLRDVDRAEAMRLGVIDRDSQITPQRRAFNDGLEAAA